MLTNPNLSRGQQSRIFGESVHKKARGNETPGVLGWPSQSRQLALILADVGRRDLSRRLSPATALLYIKI
jgi:hypothetical protein